jgi:hypothetical protein
VSDEPTNEPGDDDGFEALRRFSDHMDRDPYAPRYYAPRYYDYDGQPITMLEWSVLFEGRRSNPDLVRWKVGDYSIGAYRVSTVWLGLDHNFGPLGGVPLIFETWAQGPDLDEMDRYPSKEAAQRGHAHWIEHVNHRYVLRLIADYEAVQSEHEVAYSHEAPKNG